VTAEEDKLDANALGLIGRPLPDRIVNPALIDAADVMARYPSLTDLDVEPALDPAVPARSIDLFDNADTPEHVADGLGRNMPALFVPEITADVTDAPIAVGRRHKRLVTVADPADAPGLVGLHTDRLAAFPTPRHEARTSGRKTPTLTDSPV
jgi:hypothetical protein